MHARASGESSQSAPERGTYTEHGRTLHYPSTAFHSSRNKPLTRQAHTAPAPAPGRSPGAPPRLVRGGEEKKNFPPAGGGVARDACRGGGRLPEEGVASTLAYPIRGLILSILSI
jgi:hypothetical protein